MSKMTDREINMAAFRYAAVRVIAVLLVIGVNAVFVFGAGYDLRDWQWWLLVPVTTFFIGAGVAMMERK